MNNNDDKDAKDDEKDDKMFKEDWKLVLQPIHRILPTNDRK